MAKALGTALRVRRKALDMTQGSVARALGVSRAAVGQWEAGTHEPSTENLIAVCQLLGIEVEATVRGQSASEIEQKIKVQFDDIRSRSNEINLNDFVDRVQGIIDKHSIGSGLRIGQRLAQVDQNSSYFVMFAEPFMQVPKPIKMADIKDAYCILVCDNRLYPKYSAGDRVYVSPSELPKVGDFVIVKTAFPKNGEIAAQQGLKDAFMCVMGKYKIDDRESITLERFNPPQFIRVLLTESTSIDRVCDPDELIAF